MGFRSASVVIAIVLIALAARWMRDFGIFYTPPVPTPITPFSNQCHRITGTETRGMEDMQLLRTSHLSNNHRLNYNLLLGSCDDLVWANKQNTKLGQTQKERISMREPFPGKIVMAAIPSSNAANRQHAELAAAGTTTENKKIKLRTLKTVGMPMLDFHPHGLFAAGRTIYVVNHRRYGDAVEIFHAHGGPPELFFDHRNRNQLQQQQPSIDSNQHQDQVQHHGHHVPAKPELHWHAGVMDTALFTNLNDVVGFNDRDEFYVTNFVGSPRDSLQATFELFARRKWGNIVHCRRDGPPVGTPKDPVFAALKRADEKNAKKNAHGGDKPIQSITCRIVAKRIGGPNGITLAGGKDNDGALFVNALTEFKLNAYTRDALTGDLILVQKLDLGYACDNINVKFSQASQWNQQFDLITACHPSLFAFTQHAQNHSVPSPSVVLRIAVDLSKPEGQWMAAPELWFSSDGTDLPGSSAAVLLPDDTLIVSGVFADGMLVCPPKTSGAD